jgi:hypothetical protein
LLASYPFRYTTGTKGAFKEEIKLGGSVQKHPDNGTFVVTIQIQELHRQCGAERSQPTMTRTGNPHEVAGVSAGTPRRCQRANQ